ncbi:MFS transporter [Chromobacterium sp. IIBBL 290-4]|uniref:MFS transporter n=1 Tax=Chromobacterium sp. IIBBL 290-4 TaxID=2953890 RepID=UPI0020B70FB3|nr:MFS transporter [Chromobacterium sp. IIBBL 290-4]UTH76193.1 MFS transporter [Chromobacterium sp. IIBBL 290-4]
MSSSRLFTPALLTLAMAAFAIGTAEFIIMGLLPLIAADLQVGLPRAGYLVSGYALGVVAGGPLLAGLIARVDEKRALSGLMLIFIVGNLACLLAPGLWPLLLARVFTAFCHASFIGAAAVMAARLAPPGMAGRAMALMFSGMTLANVLGVPAGTLIGQWAGWRASFAAVAALGFITLWLIRCQLPTQAVGRSQGKTQARLPGRAWLALLASVLAAASMFAFFTYLVPTLSQVSGLPAQYASAALLLCGAGLVAGGWLGGRLADWKLNQALAMTLALLCASLAAFYLLAARLPFALALMTLWGGLAFALCMLLQALAIRQAGEAAARASAFNVGAFNLGNALGAWLAGLLLDHGGRLTQTSLLAAALAGLALLLALFISRATTAKQHALAQA